MLHVLEEKKLRMSFEIKLILVYTLGLLGVFWVHYSLQVKLIQQHLWQITSKNKIDLSLIFF